MREEFNLKVIEVHTIHDIFNFLNVNENEWRFRGQSNFEWQLESTLERKKNRILEKNQKTIINIYKLEREQLLLFKTDKPETFQSYIHEISYKQHHGCPTRLVDFTEDINVAFFFLTHGFDSATGEYKPVLNTHGALYAVNYKYINKQR